mmetsp:Transcript_12003/g.18425  ORF Transcript_12003/g.18425 Transcript_12003/m.18425 type:complete len:261 (+) Transcript_12003:286-1068(+)|eukprot:CAMPEP_0178922660 /NCGR_PEP_ID=MMETSP0786-20121207/16283_1 /TAXON_ID=186022 /ORGANISM="Thalassionema frauenfeldii, Strain CCMP 1798" /LENGTH=260 /DNA_ID=CAMNT_0020597061 /DNA_START=269 /DNA_END=1051 /DNA_ORIENTATION=+
MTTICSYSPSITFYQSSSGNIDDQRLLRDWKLCRSAYLSYVKTRSASPRSLNSDDAKDKINWECSTKDRSVGNNSLKNKLSSNSFKQRTAASRTPNDIWEHHMKDLKSFKQCNGHCRVPRHYDENPKLGRWVMNVRSHYQFLQKGKKSSLITAERLRQLTEVDFDFAPKNKSHTKYYIDRWVHHLRELRQFKHRNGHCRVPQRYKENKKLGGWVLYVRHQYRKHQNGQASTMTEERVQQLEKLGFDFEPRKGRPGRSDNL